mmetsp:Transcript_87477/g.225329  ORF Transcript_87477/g.225329 Transcript_87477/m.225329 type:complete len:294 (+) Transcript_87477:666-1547(+)
MPPSGGPLLQEAVDDVDRQEECLRAELVLLVDVHEPVDEDGAHLRVDVRLLVHVARLRQEQALLPVHVPVDVRDVLHHVLRVLRVGEVGLDVARRRGRRRGRGQRRGRHRLGAAGHGGRQHRRLGGRQQALARDAGGVLQQRRGAQDGLGARRRAVACGVRHVGEHGHGGRLRRRQLRHPVLRAPGERQVVRAGPGARQALPAAGAAQHGARAADAPLRPEVRGRAILAALGRRQGLDLRVPSHAPRLRQRGSARGGGPLEARHGAAAAHERGVVGLLHLLPAQARSRGADHP